MIEWNWQNAMTLAERARSSTSALSGSVPSTSDLDRARKRLARWKAQAGLASDPLFQQRLRQAGLTEAQLLKLLGKPAVALPVWDTALEPPPWVVEIENAFVGAFNGDGELSSIVRSDQPQHRFLEVIAPLIGRYVRRLREGIATLSPSSRPSAFSPEHVENIMVGHLPGRLLPLLGRTIVLELNVARMQGVLEGQNGEERFASFVAGLRKSESTRRFFCEYPVLARALVSALENWLACSLEFLGRWQADWPEIRKTFSPEADPGPLVKIEDEVGDRHRNGRSVWIVECRSRLKLVYKPRCMGVDQHFQELLEWLNGCGLTTPFRSLKILQRGAYGWEEFVEPKGCRSREEVVRFYERSGGYLALLYGLSATDFHQANVMAVGEHPILVDLETLFHAGALEPAPVSVGEIAGQTFLDSVIGSGLLPAPSWSERAGRAFDVSGFGSDESVQSAARIPGWEAAGTDEMRFAQRLETREASSHRPMLNGVAVSPIDYLDAIERGFQKVYRILETHRATLMAAGGHFERFAADEVRVVLRHTSTYAELLQEASHPDVLRDALDRDRLFDRLWGEVGDRLRLAELIPAEIDALWRGDVPLFTSRPGSRDLWADSTRCFKDFLDETGLERVRRRLEQFGPDDLQRQLWFLRGSLTTASSRTRIARRRRFAQNEETPPPFGRDDFIDAACAVGDRLAATAFHADGEVTWIGLSCKGERDWVLVPLGIDLYDGVAGIGLFLAYLGAVSGQGRYTTLARATVGTLRARVRVARQQSRRSELGGFTGWGGALYLFSHLAALWGDAGLIGEAHEMVETLSPHIEGDKELDIIAGAAGCIAGLLSLYACEPAARVLEVATRCGDHLLSHLRRMPEGAGWDAPARCLGPLSGFSHGAAGISWALLELAEQTQQERFRNAALEAIAYERALFSAEEQNWPDLRELEKPGQERSGPGAFPVMWCHGAPGIGLARLRCRRLNVPGVDAEIAAALRTTAARGFGSNHCLCHGDLGNLELLFEAGRMWPDSEWPANGARTAAHILASIKREGWVCGNPLGVESPGLMTGIAGIGFGLLRCVEAATVPSVLTLSPPVIRPARATAFAPAARNFLNELPSTTS